MDRNKGGTARISLDFRERFAYTSAPFNNPAAARPIAGRRQPNNNTPKERTNMGSIKKKRRAKMSKHKHDKRIKLERHKTK